MTRLPFLTLLTLALAVAGCGDDGGTDAGRDAAPGDGAPGDSAPGDSAPGDSAPGDGGPTGFDFRTDDFAMYTREDAMGMPAVSTALIPTAMKDSYQQMTPDTASFAPAALMTLAGLHMALDDDLTGLSLTPCVAAACATQRVGGVSGPMVSELVIPDTLKIDTGMAAGFPNGRMLPDQVIDITLAVILLDMTVHNPGTLAGVPVNPDENDVAYLTEFPYLAAPHAP
jgi:hypothetical protein